MKKTFKVVMLPTKKASLFNLDKDKLKRSINPIGNGYNGTYMPQHLYIISDEEIKEGDYYILRPESKIKQSWNTLPINPREWVKIEASTDKQLSEDYKRYEPHHLPQIDESFIQEYIKAYNEGKPITEVDLEMVNPFHQNDDLTQKEIEKMWFIKTNPDNTVIIHKSNELDKILKNANPLNKEIVELEYQISQMYTKDDVIKLIESKINEYTNGAECDIEYNALFNFKDWIQDNLK